ncbi:cation-transporting P-type ATPase [Planococcus sp. ISL-110]|uniref:cation-transporting P-type ATPase n=1 Tax=Planococcus sp. ISL-110 TaxID=2819167 RepID=UPI001BE82F1D|nr:cation-transporting P-type ATPase [Planococcus sp. ISL-110]MBT2571812.1 cation-transporting P-type ATPase [Planococcus sp. ISL-110]
MKQRNWYGVDTADLPSLLETDADSGLSEEEAAKRQAEFGPNELPETKKDPALIKFFKHFNDVLIYVLLAAAVITLFLGHYIDTAVILMVVVINAIIGYIQQSKAEKALDSIRKMLSLKATTIRSSVRKEVPSTELVPGDIAVLAAGDRIPADIRILEADNLNVEESSLTGESTAVEKNSAVLPDDTGLGDRLNMLFAGTTIASGSGTGIVVAIGADTELGKISSSMEEVDQLQTPLLKQTAAFGKVISLVIVISAATMFGIGYLFHDYETAELLLAIIGLTVAAIPEGLPAVLSIILALGVQRMAGKNAIVRNLPSVETLGAVTVICSDKTGTLTKNEMTVTSIMLNGYEFKITGTGYSPVGAILKGEEPARFEDHPDLQEFLTVVKTVNEAYLRCDEKENWVISGDATEGCLITVAEKAGDAVERLPILSKIPFDSSYKYMAALVERDGSKWIYVKGAPERLLKMADLESSDGEGAGWHKKMSEHANNGERLIGAAAKKVSSSTLSIDHEDMESGFRLIGLAGIIDPPREEVIEAIQQCRTAGIIVKMITGDHKDTAVAIGAQMGIGDGERVLEGKELDRMDDQQLTQAVLEYDVFARTSPNNKLQLVKALQAEQHICAMTGDGVNDAPALKRADIGVAMGIKGTEVSKEAAGMILVDDNFSTIVNAVKEGRRVYDNLKKTILFILPTNVSEGALIFVSILFGTALPLTAVQILWVNMISAVTISLAIAFEKLEPGAMKRPPRKPNAKLLSPYYIFRVAFVSFVICGGILLMNMLLADQQVDPAIINTMTLQALVMSQLMYLFNCRSETEFALDRNFFSNKVAFLVSGILVAVQLAVTYVPFMNFLLGTVPLEAQDWLWPIVIGVSVFIIVELEKWIVRLYSKSSQSSNN